MKKSLVILSVFAVGISYAQKTTEIPVFTTEKEKAEWIEKYPEKYHQPKDVKEKEFSSRAEKEAFHTLTLYVNVLLYQMTQAFQRM